MGSWIFVTTAECGEAFVTDCVVPVTTGVCRGVFVTDCGVPVTTEVRWGVLGCAGVCWDAQRCAEGCQERNIPARGDLAGILCYLPALCAGGGGLFVSVFEHLKNFLNRKGLNNFSFVAFGCFCHKH